MIFFKKLKKQVGELSKTVEEQQEQIKDLSFHQKVINDNYKIIKETYDRLDLLIKLYAAEKKVSLTEQLKKSIEKTAKCKECGKEFTVFKMKTVFCSNECRLEYYKKKYWENRAKKSKNIAVCKSFEICQKSAKYKRHCQNNKIHKCYEANN
jgi:hypothetical protein